MWNRLIKALKPQSSNQKNFTIYLVPNNDEATLFHTQELIAKAQGSNAVILSPDPDNSSSGSSGTKKYKACYLINGRWLPAKEKGKRKEVSIDFNLTQAELTSPSSTHPAIQLMSPNTPNYQNIINTALNFAKLHELSQFENLTKAIHENIIGPQLQDTKSVSSVKTASKTTHRLYQPEEKKRITKKLLDYVIHGKQAEAEKLLKKLLKTYPSIFPEIFTRKMVVKDYSGRSIKGTAFQLALGAEDVKYHDDEECMAEMLMRFVREHKDLIPHGEDMLKSQYREQFPETDEAKADEAKRIQKDSNALHQILGVITQISEAECQAMHEVDDAIQKLLRQEKSESYDPEPLKAIEKAVLYAHADPDKDKDQFEAAFKKLENYITKNGLIKANNDKELQRLLDALKAIYQFRNHLESQTKEMIEKGKHFNTELLLEAFKLYDANYQRFGRNRPDNDPYNSAKNIVCWRKVIGYIQRFVPACLAQAIHQGIYNIVQGGEKLMRLPEFRYDKPYKLFPLDSDSSFFPGYDYARGGGRVADGGRLVAARRRFYKTYVEQKHQRCKTCATSRNSIEEHSRNKIGLRRNSS